MEKLIGKIPINTFHITTLMGIKSLKKMESKKSSISSFNAISKDSDIAKGLGIQTKGGVLVHLKGNMVAAQRVILTVILVQVVDAGYPMVNLMVGLEVN